MFVLSGLTMDCSEMVYGERPLSAGFKTSDILLVFSMNEF